MYDPNEDDDFKRAVGVEVMVHELAHQWFGNLVTPRWWLDEWLSEGITTFISDQLIREVMSFLFPGRDLLTEASSEATRRYRACPQSPHLYRLLYSVLASVHVTSGIGQGGVPVTKHFFRSHFDSSTLEMTQLFHHLEV